MTTTDEPAHRVFRILVVDDSKDAADALVAMVILWGHECVGAYDAASAFALAVEGHPDAILADLSMPGLDGLELARMVRRQQDSPQPLLVAVTAYGEEENRWKAMAAGFDHFLIKPADPMLLRKLLEESFLSD